MVVSEVPTSPTRVVFLGASNLTRGISTAVATAHGLLGRPCEFLIAYGHGRSYGIDSSVLGRTLPGIVGAGLWRALDNGARCPTSALVTDVGNDLLYGQSPEQIAAWVRACLERLSAVEARIVMTALPVANFETLSRWRFALLSRLFFPMHRINFAAVCARAIELNQRLRELATAHQTAWLEPPSAWYGFDPIHVRKKFWRQAWGSMLGPWRDEACRIVPHVETSFSHWRRLRCCTPEHWRWLGLNLGRPQPAYVSQDGSRYSFF